MHGRHKPQLTRRIVMKVRCDAIQRVRLHQHTGRRVEDTVEHKGQGLTLAGLLQELQQSETA